MTVPDLASAARALLHDLGKRSACPVCGVTGGHQDETCSASRLGATLSAHSSAQARGEDVAVIQALGDAATDVFEQMLKGSWRDDHGHPVENNVAMLRLKSAVGRAVRHRDTHPTPAPSPSDLERVAEAIYHADYFGGDSLPPLDHRKPCEWSDMAETTKAEYRHLAKVAILAVSAPSPSSEVEKAREKCVLVCRRAAEEDARDHGIYGDRLGSIAANAVSMGRALLAAERVAAKEGGAK